MSLLVLPAALALFVKLWVLFVYREAAKPFPLFKLLVMVFALHNLCEVLVFWEFFRDMGGEYLLKVYHVISLVALLFICRALMELYQSRSTAVGYRLLGCWVSMVSLALLCTDLLISGSNSLAYVITAERATYYLLFQLTALLLVAAIIFQVVMAYRESSEHHVQIKSAYMGLALLPLVLAVVVVILLMNIGLPINATTILPVATTLFLVILLGSEKKHQLTDIRRFIPFSEERQTSNQIMDIFSTYSQDKLSYRDAVSHIEKLMVEHKYEKNNRNATYAAEKMGMPRSSLYSLFNRLQINKDD